MAELPQTNILPELPLDIIQSEILPRLPAKSVGRSKSVSQQWRNFLSTQRFSTMHCRHITTTTNHKLLLVDDRSCYVLDPDHDSNTIISRTIPLTLNARPSDVLVLASLDGLLCACLKNTCELVIWNPVTHVYKKLSNSNSQGFYKIGSDAVGFYVDSSNDYRILHVKRRRGTMSVFVYSRRSDSWRNIKFLMKRLRPYRTDHYVWSSGTFSRGSLYFTVSQYWIHGETMIISFDVNSETFKEIRFPGVARGRSYHGHLMDVGNCIHLLVSNGIGTNMLHWELDLWKMEGDKWKKVAGIEYIMAPWMPTFLMSNGKWLVMGDWNREVYEIDTKKKDYACVYPGHWFHTLQGVRYIETIVSPSL